MRLGYKLLCIGLASTSHRCYGFLKRNHSQPLSRASRALLQTSSITTLANAKEGDTDADLHVNMTNDMNEKSWRSLLEISIARTRKIRGSNYVQLATVEGGEPRCRTVVFRGFQKLPSDHAMVNECDSLSCLMKMCTDLRSKKVDQNKVQSTAEIVWWFPKTNEQYRIRGPLILVGSDEQEDRSLTIARKELWGNLSDPARESFLGDLIPGEPYGGEETADIPKGGRDDDGKPVAPPENFLLMLMDPKHVDYLLLGAEQHRQMDSRKDGSWSFERVNP